MKYVAKALGWTTIIFWILIITFTGTAIYSASNLRIGFGDTRVSSSTDQLMVSMPLFVNNTSYYDISDLNLTTHVLDDTSSVVSTSATLLPSIPPGRHVETAHSVTLNLTELTHRAPSYLFNDTTLIVDMILKLRYASAFALQVSQNETLDWGAPLYGFAAGGVSYQFHNATHQRATVPLSFANHSFLNVTGTILWEIYNATDDLLASGVLTVDALPQSTYEGQIEAFVDASRVTGAGTLHFSFEFSWFTFGPLVVSYG
jgi:hypothetical protein